YRYLDRLTGDPDLAHDAAQEAFTRLVTRPPHDEHPRAWLFTVATNVVRGWANSRKRRLAILQASPLRLPSADPPADPEATTEASQRRALVRGALSRLSEKERTIL